MWVFLQPGSFFQHSSHFQRFLTPNFRSYFLSFPLPFVAALTQVSSSSYPHKVLTFRLVFCFGHFSPFYVFISSTTTLAHSTDFPLFHSSIHIVSVDSTLPLSAFDFATQPSCCKHTIDSPPSVTPFHPLFTFSDPNFYSVRIITGHVHFSTLAEGSPLSSTPHRCANLLLQPVRSILDIPIRSSANSRP